MDKKQDIGAAFKQRLTDLHQGPSDSAALWDSISAQLDAEGTTPKGMPFWLKSGLTVLIVGLVSLGVWKLSTSSEVNENTTPLTESSIPAEASDGSNNSDGGGPTGNSEAAAKGTEISATDTEEQAGARENEIASENIEISEGTATESAISGVNAESTGNVNTESTTITNSEDAISNDTTVENTSTAISTSNTESTVSETVTNSVANSENTSTSTSNTQTAVASNSNNTTSVNSSTATTASANPVSSGSSSNNSTAVGSNSQSSSSAIGSGREAFLPTRDYFVIRKNTASEVGISSTNFPVVYKPEEGQMAESLPPLPYSVKKQKKSKEARALERALNREEAITYKWSVGAVIAPTTYGSLTRASMLDARLENNTREGETNLSYGLQVKNQFNRKSGLRFGINRVNVGYNTQNFQVNIIDGVVNIYQLTGIDPGAEIEEGGIPLNPDATQFFESNDVVTIDQDISYLEIPVEYQYSFINESRFGANLIGGASLMVLDDNRIFAVNDAGQSVPVGKSSNLTGLGYTINLGMGLKYDISKHFQLNLDPMLKIQMNSPENTSTNNFRPYYFGIFSGLHFKF